MSRIESGFIPLPKVEQEQPLDNVVIRLGLPSFVDQDRIGVNLSRIDSLNRLSGIERLSVFGKSEAQNSRGELNVVRINPDGSALASKTAAVTKVNLFDSKSIGENSQSSLREITLVLNINIDELATRALYYAGGIRSVSPWIEGIDGSIRTGIRKSGTENLTKLTSADKSLLKYMGLISSAVAAYDYFTGNGIFFLEYLGILVVADKILDRERSMRKSVFPCYLPQLDRAAVLQVKARTQKLVADLRPDKT